MQIAVKTILVALALSFTLLPSAHAQNSLPWLVVNDSIVSSYTPVGEAKNLPFNRITQQRNVDFHLMGTPGANLVSFNAPEFFAAMSRQCGPLRYCEGVIVQAGVNDANWQPIANQQAALEAILNYAQANNMRAIVLDIIHVGPAATETAGVTASRTMRQTVCNARGAARCVYFPRNAAFNVANPYVYQSDYVHLTDAGKGVYADWVRDIADFVGLF